MPDDTHNVSDADGYRPNVGIVLFNNLGQVLWARRTRHDGWQFPQGGVEQGETIEQAAYRCNWSAELANGCVTMCRASYGHAEPPFVDRSKCGS